jgi:hypothetical protein
MKKFTLWAALAALFACFMTGSISAQNIVVDSVNFKGATNIFISRHGTGAPASSCTGIFEYIQDDDTTGQPIWVCQAGTMVHTSGGSSTFTVNQGVAANGTTGALATVPEKGYATVSGLTSVAWDEDFNVGHFDCRDPKYGPGGCFGTRPQQAMQDLANDMVCYQANTGLHANTTFPPGIIPIGTTANPTLQFPTGAAYYGTVNSYTGSGTTFNATYDNVLALHFVNNLTATCSGTTKTSTLTDGHYEGFSVHGCAQGGCVQTPGGSTTYSNGGPNQQAMLFEDNAGLVWNVGSDHNGSDGVNVSGESTIVGPVFGFGNNWYQVSAKGLLYNPATDGQHANIILGSLDGQFLGPFTTFGYLQTPGAEYGHVFGTIWGGGDTHMGPVFSNRDEIGELRASGSSNGRQIGGRIDAPMGEGISVASGGNSFSDIDNSSACSGFSTVAKGTLFGPWISSVGSGMTNGTYTVNAVNASGDTTGSGGQLTLTVAGGVATNLTVNNIGSLYLATPTFPVTGTGGTPAVIGATTYQHCDKLDDGAGGNSFSNVKNIFESFFGTDHSTGDIWAAGASGGSDTFDRGTTGYFERITGIVNEPKGIGTHKDLVDKALPSGGVAVTGPAVNFTGGNHFISGDTSATVWNGPFTVDHIMQDIWIMGGNSNTTLPYTNWISCTGYDINLGEARWYHFFVFRDDVFFGPGQNFLFVEQCDTTNQNFWNVGHGGQTAPSATNQFTLDTFGSSIQRQVPMVTPTVSEVNYGGDSSFTYCYFVDAIVWGEPWQSPSVCIHGTPVPSQSPNVQFIQIQEALPWGIQQANLYLGSSTDPAFTPGRLATFTTPTGQQPNTPYSFNFIYNSDTTTPSGSVPYHPTAGINGTGGYNSHRNPPVTSAEPCPDGDFAFGAAPASIGSGHGKYECHPANTWIYYPDNTGVTSF